MPAASTPSRATQARHTGAPTAVTIPEPGGVFGQGRALRPSSKQLPGHARHNNRSLVLQTLYRGGQLSRADIARETGLTRVTISDLVAHLLEEGLLLELGHREESRPGKPGTLVDINRSAFHIVGIDLSDSTVFRGAVLDLDGQIVAYEVSPVGLSQGQEAVDKCLTLIKAVIKLATSPILGIGIGSPGIVDLSGSVLRTRTLGWFNLDLKTLIAEHFSVPVVVINDANAAVLAEHAFGAADGDLMLIRVGRGVGAGLLVHGQLIQGGQFAAGEIGHTVVGTDGGPICNCGKLGCLDAWLAPGKLAAALAKARSAKSKDAVLAEAGHRLGILLAPIVAALNLTRVVVSGPPELFDHRITAAAQATIRERMMADYQDTLTLEMTSLGKDIVMRGAAVMVLSTELGVS